MFVALMSPFLLGGEVVSPHQQTVELGIEQTSSARVENRKFNDFSIVYIPEISQHLSANQSGWLATWSTANELGRPLYHLSGFSPAYLPGWLLAQITNDPLRYITILSLLTCFLTGIFTLLLVRELELSSFAAFCAAWLISTSPLFIYWLTFPVFLAVWCWSTATLFALVRLSKRIDFIGWGILGFSIYSLLMTAYPQPIIFHAYLIGGWFIFRLIRLWREMGVKTTIQVACAVATATLVGVACVIPVYIDLVGTVIDSARIATDASFFTAALPQLDSLAATIRFLALSTFPEILGDPILSSYPLPYNGLSLTSVFLLLVLASFGTVFKETWGWWLAVLVILLFAFVHPLYVLGVNYLGFNLSRSTPVGILLLPFTLISAYTVDAFTKQSGGSKFHISLVVSSMITLFLLCGAIIFFLISGLPVFWVTVTLSFVVIMLFFAQIIRPWPVLLIAAFILVAGYVSWPMLLRQDPADIVWTSPLVESVREHLPTDARYAVVGKPIAELPPNLNASLDLASVHTYNSLSKRRYHTLINELGGDIHTYGRHNWSIGANFDSPAFYFSNIGLVLSNEPIEHQKLSHVGTVDHLNLYRVDDRMGCCLRIRSQQGTPAENIIVEVPKPNDILDLKKINDTGDLLVFEISPEPQGSILILSQKYYPDWQAQVLVSNSWQKAETFYVNNVFQGVYLPEYTSGIQLRFEPFVRYAWIGHIFFLTLFIVMLLKVGLRNGHEIISGFCARIYDRLNRYD